MNKIIVKIPFCVRYRIKLNYGYLQEFNFRQVFEMRLGNFCKRHGSVNCCH